MFVSLGAGKPHMEVLCPAPERPSLNAGLKLMSKCVFVLGRPFSLGVPTGSMQVSPTLKVRTKRKGWFPALEKEEF